MFKRLAWLLCVVLLMPIWLGCSGSLPTGDSTPTTDSSSSGREITLADNSRTISLKVNEEILLKLGETYNWVITIPDQSIISRVMNIAVVRGAQGVYTAHKAGQTTLEAIGDPTCRQSDPPCEMPSISFKVTIIVTP